MSEENLDLVRKGYEAFNRGDWEAVQKLLAPDIELQRASGMGTVQGSEAVIGFAAPDAFAWQELEPQGEVIDHGDRLLVALRARARGTESHLEIEQSVFHVIKLRDGKIAEIEVYFDRAEALEALGQSE